MGVKTGWKLVAGHYNELRGDGDASGNIKMSPTRYSGAGRLRQYWVSPFCDQRTTCFTMHASFRWRWFGDFGKNFGEDSEHLILSRLTAPASMNTGHDNRCPFLYVQVERFLDGAVVG